MSVKDYVFVLGMLGMGKIIIIVYIIWVFVL